MSEILQWAAAIVVLAAFALSQWGRWSVLSYRYLCSNFVGGAGLSAAAVLSRQWGFVVLEGIWALVAVAKHHRPAHATRGSRPSRPDARPHRTARSSARQTASPCTPPSRRAPPGPRTLPSTSGPPPALTRSTRVSPRRSQSPNNQTRSDANAHQTQRRSPHTATPTTRQQHSGRPIPNRRSRSLPPIRNRRPRGSHPRAPTNADRHRGPTTFTTKAQPPATPAVHAISVADRGLPAALLLSLSARLKQKSDRRRGRHSRLPSDPVT